MTPRKGVDGYFMAKLCSPKTPADRQFNKIGGLYLTSNYLSCRFQRLLDDQFEPILILWGRREIIPDGCNCSGPYGIVAAACRNRQVVRGSFYESIFIGI